MDAVYSNARSIMDDTFSHIRPFQISGLRLGMYVGLNSEEDEDVGT
jgi:hypothetical protein